EILGVVQIENRLLISGEHHSQVSTRFGLIHYELSSALDLVYEPALHAPWFWTAGTEHSHIKLKQQLPKTFRHEIFKDTDLSKQYCLIREIAQSLKNEAIPIVTERFKKLACLQSYCEETNQRGVEYCAILALSGDAKTGAELAEQIHQNPRLFDQHCGVWQAVGPAFAGWISTGNPSKSLEDARNWVLNGAIERREEVMLHGRQYEW
ncbi:MAG TPA: hypothetical protein PKE54_11535, partial [Candidatus Obscuribacter sp.]|nr:hypothetical protein [Candidatus Obscuribacter sp.]